MFRLSGIIENYIEYANNYSGLLNNYINTYGHDARYVKAIDMNDEYINALGRDKVGFNYSSDNYKYINIKILIDYTDWFRYYVGQEIDTIIYYSMPDANKIVATGDIIIMNTLNHQNFYRITDVPTTFNDILYKATLKLIQSKIINNK